MPYLEGTNINHIFAPANSGTFCGIYFAKVFGKRYRQHIFEESFATSQICGTFFFYMQQIINIPISLIQRFKNDRKSLEMLACAYMIKREYQHSTLYNINVVNVMKFFGCSHKKALKLMDAFRESPLFVYNEKKKSLFAKTFKDKTVKLFGHKANKKYKAISDYCYKMVRTEATLRMIVKTLRYVLLTNAIHAKETDNSKVTLNFFPVTKPDRGSAISQRKLANVISMSRTSACRYINDLVKAQIVGKSEIVAECVIPELNAETASTFMQHNPKQRFFAWHNAKSGHWSGWVVFGYAYSILSKATTDRLRHVIYNYKYPVKLVTQFSCENDGEGFFNRFS